MSVFSTPAQLASIQKILSSYLRLPFSTDSVPGAFMEAVLAHVRDGRVLATYDYVDVVQERERVGWSIKSTKAATPLTWKRAKIADKVELIVASQKSQRGLQNLGNEIIRFCNAHAQASLRDRQLDAIGYARLIIFPDHRIRYFERELCTRTQPHIFEPSDFIWRWSRQKEGGKKEQLSALHGFHKRSGERWWAWHGHGENQLHFTGERAWWPSEHDPHAITFPSPNPNDRVSLERLTELLERL